MGTKARGDGRQADDELPVRGTVDVALPVEQLWGRFSDVARWPSWNPCFAWARVRGGELTTGATLVWAFNPIRPWYLYRLPATAKIVEYDLHRRVTWEVAMPGFWAHHSYLFEADGPDRCRFGSWEVADGPLYRAARRFWLAHFRYVCGASLAGARRLGRPAPPVRLIRFGTPSAHPPLLVVPGLDGSPGSVAPIVEQLAREREVVVADYGEEDHPDLDGLSDAVADAARALSQPFDVMGQSIGTIVAAQVAARLPDVRRVVLACTFTRLRWAALRISAALVRRTPPALYRATSPALMALVCGPVGDGAAHPFFQAIRESRPAAAARRTAWQVGRDFSPDLVGFHQPGLVLMGTKDRFVPNPRREVAKLRRLFDGHPVTVETIAGAGHVLLPSAAIDEAVGRIEAFLA